MELVYIVIGLGKKRWSISEKVHSQIKELNALGVSTKGFFFSNEVTQREQLEENIICFPLQANKKRKYFNSFFQGQDNALQVKDILKRELPANCFIYLRYSDAGYGFFKLLNQFEKRIILYLPSHPRERFVERKYSQFGSWGSFLFRWLEYFCCYYIQEKIFYWFFARKLRLLATFTPEFARIMRKKCWGKLSCIYNGDGTNSDEVKLRVPTYNGEKIRLLFMKGSVSNQYWSGLSRLINSINNGFQDKFELYITGVTHGEKYYQQPFVHLTGKLSSGDLNKLCNEVDLGVSNLANYLIHFNETTNMKSREYYARGLPFIQSNTMPDVTGLTEDKFFLCLPNNSSLIDMKMVYDFAIKMRAEKNHTTEMRIFAKKYLDWKVKMKELKEILEKELTHN